MRRSFALGTLLLCLGIGFFPVYGQGNCSIGTIAGTYAFNFTGASAFIASTTPVDGFHWSALYAPIAGVGIYTVTPSASADAGTVKGSYWIVAGGLNLGHSPLEPTPLDGTISVNPDCTGAINYKFGPYDMKEDLLVLDNGGEIRSMAVQTAVPTSTWNTTSRRIVGACLQNKIIGSYLFSCKSLFTLDPANTFAGTSYIHMNISRDGSSTGTFAGKFGPVVVPPTQVTGTFNVNEDCTAAGTLDFGIGQSVARGVFFNEGKEGYWLPLVLNPGEVPQPYGYCDIKQVANR